MLQVGNPIFLPLFSPLITFPSIDQGLPKSLFALATFPLAILSLIKEEEIVFSFQLELQAEKYSKIRLEYGMDFMKANGKLSRKIFQISEKTYEQGTFSITKKHSFVNRTTRKHYLGKHRIAIIVNGEEKTVQDFELVSVN